jgi:hypothetical protein
MKRYAGIFALSAVALIACAAIAVNSAAQADASNSASNGKWVGVWQGQLEGVPGVVLTLGDDLGDVNGTIVFTALRDGRIAGHATHVILHPHVDGNTLSFQVKREGKSPDVVDMSLQLTSGDKAQLVCPKCGAHSPTEMTKEL